MYDITETARQSPPLDLTAPINTSGLAGRLIVITGGASGLGAALARHWAAHGAHIVVGDVADETGHALVAELRELSEPSSLSPPPSTPPSASSQNSHPHHHYIHVDVTSWESQASLFEEAVRLSQHGGIDVVVACAGSAGARPAELAGPSPAAMAPEAAGRLPKPARPDLSALEVNVTGTVYTAYLSLFWLSRNKINDDGGGGGSSSNRGSPARDRHLLLVGSCASLMPLPGAPVYAASKHAVLGLFRSLRSTAAVGTGSGVRVNLLCPYFLRTGMAAGSSALARGALLAGTATAAGPSGCAEAVEAATRLVADRAVAGRAVATARRVRVRGHGEEEQFDVLEMADAEEGEERNMEREEEGSVRSAWEVFPHDLQRVEAFGYRFVTMLAAVQRVRGWAGWIRDALGAVMFGLGWSA